MSCIFFDSRSKIKEEISTDSLITENFLNLGSSLELQIEDSIHQISNDSIKCEGRYCFALWNVDSTNNTNFFMQGCWEHPDRPDCDSADCVARTPLNRRSMRNLTRFCCCHGYHCNRYVADNVDMSISYSDTYQNNIEIKDRIFTQNASVILVSICMLTALLLIMVAVLVFLYCKRYSKSTSEAENKFFVEKYCKEKVGQILDMGLFVDWQLISRGRYGDVHKARYLNNQFAIKTFYANHENYYLNELWMYTQPCLKHLNIVPFFGHFNNQPISSFVNCAGSLNGVQCGLVLKHAGCGSLVGLLRRDTISWDLLCSLARDIASAINCLHSEYSQLGELKRMIVHRDINSRNILVSTSMRAQLCDFGFAMEVGLPHKSNMVVHPPILPTDSNVGTIRYMAPEILEGCVNLGENRIALKQVDIYAFALVLWEMTTRCHHLHNKVGELMLAYEAELGKHPSREDMHHLVAIAKIRPNLNCSIPHQSFHFLQQTIEECWDDDAEARLSATTILHRLHQLNRPITIQQIALQPISIQQQTIIDEGAEDCLSSSSSQSPVSDISNSVSIAMETVTRDISVETVAQNIISLENKIAIHHVVTATKSDGNSSGIGGLSGESTLSFDRPPHNKSTNNHYNPTNYLQHIPSDYDNHDYEYYLNNAKNEYLNPSLGVDLPFLVSNDKYSGFKIKNVNKNKEKNVFVKIKNWFSKI